MTQIVSASNLTFIIHTSLSEIAALNDRAESVRMLVSAGESAFAQRRWDDLAQVGEILANSFLPAPYQAIGAYYTGLAASFLGQSDREAALRAIEHAALNAPPVFQARALLSLGTIAANVGDRTSEAGFYREAIDRATRDDSRDIHTVVNARRGVAISLSLEGDHHRALDELESLWPMVRAIAAHDPVAYLDWLNSLAVELGEVGQVEQASKAAHIVIASPFASAYPYWQETADDLATMQSQAIIIQVPEIKPEPETVPAIEPEIIPLPEPEPVSKTSSPPGPISLISWLWFLARPHCLAPMRGHYTAPVLINPTLALYVKRARIRAPDFPSI